MKQDRFDRLLKSRGYQPRIRAKYKGVSSYSKEHLYFEIVCYVEKDSHGKGQTMSFNIYDASRTPQNMDEFRIAEFDRAYLVKEANIIHSEFEALKKR